MCHELNFAHMRDDNAFTDSAELVGKQEVSSADGEALMNSMFSDKSGPGLKLLSDQGNSELTSQICGGTVSKAPKSKAKKGKDGEDGAEEVNAATGIAKGKELLKKVQAHYGVILSEKLQARRQ